MAYSMAVPRRVLVLNTGSSSLKWVVLDARDRTLVSHGDASWEGTEGGRHERELLAALQGVGDDVDAVGHRVVHGGARFRSGVLIDADVRAEIEALVDLAPLHNPAALAGIDAVARRFPSLPQVAAFDTAFHATLPAAAASYALPADWVERWALRRYGFHGLSVQYAVGRAPEVLGRPPARLIVCHLGAGCSVTAVLDGRSVDTSMGFTPLEGLAMARRSGSVDPGLLLHLLAHGVSVGEVEHGLNERSGLLGLSGVSADMRAVLAAEGAGDQRAALAIAVFVHRLVVTVAGMLPTLGGLDALVFTGGIGEHSPVVRERACRALGFLGLKLDPTANTSLSGADADVAAADSRVRVPVIAAREDLAVLEEVNRVLGAT
jgi:acetate kinase